MTEPSRTEYGVVTRFTVLDSEPFVEIDAPPEEVTIFSGLMAEYEFVSSTILTQALQADKLHRITVLRPQMIPPPRPALHDAQTAHIGRVLNSPHRLPMLIASTAPDVPGNSVAKTILLALALAPPSRTLTMLLASPTAGVGRLLAFLGALPHCRVVEAFPSTVTPTTLLPRAAGSSVSAGSMGSADHVYLARHTNLPPAAVRGLADMALGPTTVAITRGSVRVHSRAALTVLVETTEERPVGWASVLKLPATMLDGMTLPVWWDSASLALRDVLISSTLLSRHSAVSGPRAETSGAPGSVEEEMALVNDHAAAPMPLDTYFGAIQTLRHGMPDMTLADADRAVIRRFAESVRSQLDATASPDLELMGGLGLGLVELARGLAVLRGRDVDRTVVIDAVRLVKMMLEIRFQSPAAGVPASRSAKQGKKPSKARSTKDLLAALEKTAKGRGSSVFVMPDIIAIGQSVGLDESSAQEAVDRLNQAGALVRKQDGTLRVV
ncbi:hypothetical protein J8273_7221 [Carpediemonas membranifera]|uniref:MCM8/REC winged helix domain-containing protein n=1 Tax=Carpediemonas membranifera TaxID=201153 RepID=A0A8J6AXN9_9EUKA|nr:hypothetical protein J8273_7221 [Carpediemonas membranifera]|eukprot:KAG9390948.1 hypothetical protein J8273_7221 [Carpediemonas membranifera]